MDNTGICIHILIYIKLISIHNQLSLDIHNNNDLIRNIIRVYRFSWMNCRSSIISIFNIHWEGSFSESPKTNTYPVYRYSFCDPLPSTMYYSVPYLGGYWGGLSPLRNFFLSYNINVFLYWAPFGKKFWLRHWYYS